MKHYHHIEFESNRSIRFLTELEYINSLCLPLTESQRIALNQLEHRHRQSQHSLQSSS